MAVEFTLTSLTIVNFLLEAKQCVTEEFNTNHNSTLQRTDLMFRVGALTAQYLLAGAPVKNLSYTTLRILELIGRAAPLGCSVVEYVVNGLINPRRGSAGRGIGLHALVRRAVASATVEKILPKSFNIVRAILNVSEISWRTGFSGYVINKIERFTKPFFKRLKVFFRLANERTPPPPPIDQYDLVRTNSRTLPDVLSIDPMFPVCPITMQIPVFALRDDVGGHSYDHFSLGRWLVLDSYDGTLPMTRQPPTRLSVPSLTNHLAHGAHLFFWSYVGYRLRTDLSTITAEQTPSFYRRLKELLEAEPPEIFQAAFNTEIPYWARYHSWTDTLPNHFFPFCPLTNNPIRYPVRFRGGTTVYERDALYRALDNNPGLFSGKSRDDVERADQRHCSIELQIERTVDDYKECREQILRKLLENPSLWDDSRAHAG